MIDAGLKRIVTAVDTEQLDASAGPTATEDRVGARHKSLSLPNGGPRLDERR